MLGNILPPYHSLQELNLDWILTKVKDMLRFLPDDGSVGQILRRTAHGAEWSNEQGGGGAVSSVNGQTGDVVLTAADVGALADTTVIPTDTSDLTNTAGFVDAAGAAAAAPVQSVNGQTGAVTITAPVTSVNGQTGAVSLTIPDSTSDLVNDSGFVDSAGAAAAAPVQSVNGQTGAVTIPTSAVHSVNISGTTDSSGDFNLSSYITISDHVPIGFRKTSTFSFSAVLFGQTGSGTAWYMKILNDNAGNMSNQAFQGILYYLDV